MSDDLTRDLEQIDVPAIPNDYAALKSLIQTLPAPLGPEVRSAATGQTTTQTPGVTSAAQTVGVMGGVPPGMESGASIGVVSELFYGSSNMLTNPSIDAISNITIPTTLTKFAYGWECQYVLNSGSAPGTNLQIDLTYSRFSRADNPLNSAMSGLYFPAVAAWDGTVYIRGQFSIGSGYDNELPFLTASVKVGRYNDINSAGVTKMRARMEILVDGVVFAGEWYDLLTLSNKGTIVRLSAAVSRPGGGWWASNYRWRLAIEYARANSTGSDYMFWGEPVLAYASSQSPVPYTPMLAGWYPDELAYRRAGDNVQRLRVGGYDPPVIEFGSGSAATDIKIVRGSAGRLVIGGNGQSVATEVAIESTSGQRAKFDARVAGDTDARAQMWGDATRAGIEFGPGNTQPDTMLYRNGTGILKLDSSGTYDQALQIGDDATLYDVDTADMLGIKGQQTAANGGLVFGSAKDTNLYRAYADALKTDDAFVVGGGYLHMPVSPIIFDEISEPGNAGANQAYLFVKDNGSGKTQLCVRFSSGATIVLATEA